jgi:ribosome recycling factor
MEAPPKIRVIYPELTSEDRMLMNEFHEPSRIELSHLRRTIEFFKAQEKIGKLTEHSKEQMSISIEDLEFLMRVKRAHFRAQPPDGAPSTK